MPRLCILALLLLNGWAGPLHAQDRQTAVHVTDGTLLSTDGPLRFEHLTVEDGLPENSAFAILQDHLGYLWFGTQNGLVRYDGYTMEVFVHDPDDPCSLGGRSIREIHEDPAGDLWVSTSRGGLHRYDRDTECFTHYVHDPDDPRTLGSNFIQSFTASRHGDFWLLNAEGLDQFDPETGQVTRHRHNPDDPHSLPNAAIHALHEDRNGVLWIGTGKGLSRFDRQASRFITYLHVPDDPESIAHDAVYTMADDPEDFLWVGTEGGLDRFDPAVETFTHYRHDPGDPHSLSHDTVYVLHLDAAGVLWIGTRRGLNRFEAASATFSHFLTEPEDPASAYNIILSIYEDQTRRLWITTPRPLPSGSTGDVILENLRLFSFMPATGRFTPHRNDPDDPYSFDPGSGIMTFYQDHTGILWIGTWIGGLNKLDRSTQKFSPPWGEHVSDAFAGGLRSIHEDEDGTLWVGTASFDPQPVGGGFYQIDRTTGRITPYRHGPQDPRAMVMHILRDRQGQLWVGGLGGIERFDPATASFTPYVPYPDAQDPRENYAYDMAQDHEGRFWLVTYGGGLVRFDPATATFKTYRHDPDDPNSPSHDRIMAVCVDREGILWLGMWNQGLSRFDPATETFTHYFDPLAGLHSVLDIHEDRKGRLWVGTFNGGLLHLDRKTGKFTYYTTDDGLVHNQVESIAEDDHGNLWLATLAGLSRFDPERRAFKNFDAGDGLPSNEFRSRAAFKLRSGPLIFVSVEGPVAILPDQIEENAYPPEVVLSGLRLFDEPVYPREGGPLEQSLAETDEIRLSHRQNDITLEFAALHYSRPSQNWYAYMLEGYDDAWREAGTQRTATYTNLSPGDYRFRVKAANYDGVWNEEGASVRLTILPPWWRTWWAYALYGLLFAAGVFLIDRVQRRRLIARERAQAQEREQERERQQARQLKAAYDALEISMQRLTETQDQLIHSEKMASLGALTAGIAHEIKNPLNFVNNFAGLSRELIEELEQENDPEEVKAILSDLKTNAEKIEEHGQRADAIVRAMMQHARGGAGHREPVALNAFVDEYVDLAWHGRRAQQPDFNVELVRDYGAEVGSVEVVPQEMGRVLINLLSNAFDAVEEQKARVNGQYAPRVQVSTTRSEEGPVEVRIEDNGPGIPGEKQAQIFEPFFTTKPTGKGTGLGLSMSYDIVTQGHGGTLAVESEEGQGAAFVVRLPGEAHGQAVRNPDQERHETAGS